ncbi:MAG: hypothetical protein IKX66_04880 [Clostridia bacterium]|nr:hypothetical protein [Clostridia bacterium]
MRKRLILCAFFAIPLILFNLLFFLIGDTVHPKSVWIAYAWMQLAFVLLIATPWLARKGENGPVYRITLALISAGYCLVEFIVGLIVIIIAPAGVKGAVIAQVIPFCLYLFILLGDLLFIELAADSEQKEKARAQKTEKDK